MKHVAFNQKIIKFVKIISIAFLLCSNVSFADIVPADEESSFHTNKSEDCNSDTLSIGGKICPDDLVVNFTANAVGPTILKHNILGWFGWNSSKLPKITENASNRFFENILSSFKLPVFYFASLICLISLIQLILTKGKEESNGIKHEVSYRLSINSAFIVLLFFMWPEFLTILIGFFVFCANGIMSAYFYFNLNPSAEEIKIAESENKISSESMQSNIMATARSTYQSKVPYFQANISKAADMKLSDALEQLDDEYQLEWVNEKVSKTNFDFTYKLWNMINSYEFVSIINYRFKSPPEKRVFTPLKMEQPVGTYLADNTVFTDIDGSLQDGSVNDGFLLKSLYLGTIEASRFPVNETLNAYYNVIKADLKANSYSELNTYDSVSQIVYDFAENVGSTVASNIKSETTDPADVATLITSSFKKLSDATTGNNTNMTISEFVKFGDETARLEKLSFCSKNYDEYSSARINVGKLNYSETIAENLRRNAFSFNSCIAITRDKIEVVGFDGQKEQDKLLDLEQSIEARKLALERLKSAIPTAFQHAADNALNADSEKGSSVLQKGDEQLAVEAMKGGFVVGMLKVADIQNVALNRMKSKEAFKSTNVYMFNGEINPDSDYIVGGIMFKTSSENEKSEAEKSLRETYVNPYSDFTYTKYDKADFNDLNSIENSSRSSKDAFDYIQAEIFDATPLQLAMGLSTNRSFIEEVKYCNEHSNCEPKNIKVTAFLSLMGASIFKSVLKIIVINEVVNTLKNLIDNVADSVESSAGASTQAKGFNIKSLVKGVKIFLGGTTKALLGVVSAGLTAASALAWPLAPISFALMVFPPFIPFFMAAFLMLRFISFFMFFALTGQFIILFKFWKKDFNLFLYLGSVAVNFARLPIGLFFIFTVLILDDLLGYGPLLMALAGAVAIDFMGMIAFAIIATVLMVYVAKWLIGLQKDLENSTVEALGGDKNEFGVGLAEIGLVMSKLTTITMSVKNEFTEQVGKFRASRAKPSETAGEEVKFKDAPKP